MKISIITVVKNNKSGLLRAIECVKNQTHNNIEHIIIDGGSDDGTAEFLNQYQDDSEHSIHNKRQTTNYSLLSISETDKGIYDAINKGIKLATGDVIGLLHSDDLYADENVISRYAEVFNSDSGPNSTSLHQSKQAGMMGQVDAVYSDLVYVRQNLEVRNQKSGAFRNIQSNNHSIIRYWKTQKKEFTTESQRHKALQKGWMPPHPTLFIRKEIFDKYGLYRTDMKIASDYEMILRLLFKHKITVPYLPITTYLISIGGASNKSLMNILQKSKEDYRAMKINGINFPAFTLAGKNLRKLPQFLSRE